MLIGREGGLLGLICYVTILFYLVISRQWVIFQLGLHTAFPFVIRFRLFGFIHIRILSVFFREISKSVHYLRRVCLSVQPSVRMEKTGLPLDGIS